MFVTNIVLLNSLIAIIGDSYEKVQLDQAYYDTVQKFYLLNELNDIYMFINRNSEVESVPKHVMIIKYVDHNVAQREWSGRIKSITELINDNMKKINS